MYIRFRQLILSQNRQSRNIVFSQLTAVVLRYFIPSLQTTTDLFRKSFPMQYNVAGYMIGTFTDIAF